MRLMSVAEIRGFLDRHPAGAYTLLDVRQPFEYQEMHLPGARLIPLADLSEQAAELERDKPVLVYCRSGHRSQAAAGMLEGLGFSDVASIQGGIEAWQGGLASGPAHQGLPFCLAAVDREDLLLMACAMEMVLQECYEDLMARAESQDLRLAFRQLAGFEVRHRERLYRLYAKDAKAPLARQEFENSARSRARSPESRLAEGGVDAGQFMGDQGSRLEQARDALELAMQFEAQALDYYLRCNRAGLAAETAKALSQLAQEERAHLRMLAGLLERRAGEN